MQNAGHEASLKASRQIQIGRVIIDIVSSEQGFVSILGSPEKTATPCFVLVLPLEGRVTFSQEGRTGVVGTGEYVLLTQTAFYELSTPDAGKFLMVSTPAAELRGRLVAIDDHISRRFKANVHMGYLLSDLFRNIAELFADRPPPNPQALATEIISFVALTIGAEDRGAATDVRNGRYHLRRRIIEFIERNLSDQSLSPRKIAASSRISLSYLYCLFNDDETTVGQFVQAKRLQRAYEILVADPRGHRTVSEIAYEVGFKNVSHFSRSFSRRFNIAPRDARQLAESAYSKAVMNVACNGVISASGDIDGLTSPYWGATKHRSLHETA